MEKCNDRATVHWCSSGSMKSEIDPSHGKKRKWLRFVGPVFLGLGVICTSTAFIDFVLAVNGRGEPKLFWMAFIGMPMMFFGFVLTSAGFMGAAHRYVANETAPVAKDTLNYMADGTKEGIQTIATAVGTGIRTGMSGQAAPQVRCHKCNHANDAHARFCQQCGTPLGKSIPCPSCDELNDPDAKFCDECGQPLQTE
jgi:hypothetical protein